MEEGFKLFNWFFKAVSAFHLYLHSMTRMIKNKYAAHKQLCRYIQEGENFQPTKWSRSVMSDSLRPVDYSPPSSSVHGIFQARILEWVAISFSSAWKWKVKMKLLSLKSCVRLLATPWIVAHQAPPSMGFSRQKYWSGVPLPSPTDPQRSPFYI